MEMIRIYNRKTGEILEKTFTNSEDADNYEVILDFLMAEYERYHDGEMICASEGEEKFMLKCFDDPVYENEDYDNMSDEDWDMDEEDFDDEKVFE